MSRSSILIVGANRGIGLGLVREALKVHPDAIVFATARNVSKATDLNALASANKNVVVLAADTLKVETLNAAVVEIKKHTDSLQYAVFNAGVWTYVGRIQELSGADLLTNLEGNVVGPHNLLVAFSPLILAGKGKVAMISSAGASIAALPEFVPFIKKAFKTDYLGSGGYVTTKTALNMLGRQWADELEPKGCPVGLIHPGSVSTDMNPGDGTIPVEEAVPGIWKVINELEGTKGQEGILGYDGTVFPW